jgi:hypothetical protein
VVSSGSEDDEIRRLYRASYAASSAGNLEEGKALLLRAWAIRRTYDVASALGQVELALDEPREAAEHLDFALRNFPPQQSADMFQQVRADFAKAMARVGSLSVRVSSAGAQVFVDGKFVGTTPLTAPLFLDPGKHTIEAKRDGAHAEQTIVARANVAENLALTVPEPQRQEPTSVPSESPPAEQRSPLPYVLGGAAIAVGLGVGVGFAIAAGNKTDRAGSLRSQLAPGECFQSRSGSGPCSELRDAVNSHNQFRDVSTVGFAFSGAALAATLVYWGVTSSPSSHEKANAFHLSASASERDAAIWVRGSF